MVAPYSGRVTGNNPNVRDFSYARSTFLPPKSDWPPERPILAPRCWPVPGACDNDEKAKAWNRLGICGCREHADRLKTKFVADAEGDWSYYPNPECITKECPLQPVPNDIVHQDGIHALNPYDDRLPEFDQMRREGVLFIYQGQPACFWPPEQSDG
jgi:hypothetical protein